MIKIMRVEIEIDENIDSTDIRENINTIGYLSEKPIKVVNVEMKKNI